MTRLIMGFAMCGLACAGWAGAQAQQPTVRRPLAQATEILGYRCAKGYAWFYADGRLKECAVARDADFGVARVPAGSWINLTQDGKPDFVFLVRDTNIAGYQCRGGNRLLGPTEGATTGFYPSGELKLCWLTEGRDVQGVPCVGSGLLTGDSSVRFYESGTLQACALSKDYGSWKRGQRFSQAQ